MDWQAIGTIVALVGVSVSFILTIRGQRQEREIAENTALRVEAAARLTEAYATRVVDALEAIAANDGLGGQHTIPQRVQWSLTHHSGDAYLLQNVGSITAMDVAVEGHESLIGPDHLQGKRDLAPDEALTFMAVRTLATSDSTVTVSWTAYRGGSPEREAWQYPLPPRPPR